VSPPPEPPLSIEAVRAHLTTRTIGANLSVHDEVDSTNRLLVDLAHKGAADGTVVVADSQTAGHGRMGRQWVSPPGLNLYLSILLTRPQVAAVLTWIPLLAAVAIIRAVRNLTQLAARLKWPNDVLVLRNGNGHKLAGILVEAIGGGPAGARLVVVGIGVNVNMPIEAFPKDLCSTATSLLIETGRSVERARLLASLLAEMEVLYDQLCDQGPEGIAAVYRESCDTIGRRVRIELMGSEQVEGMAEGIAHDGALRLRGGDGKMLEIRAGDVVHLR
jgi:BirA family transcriptional regulator, biotin operon repressor / biotin---[acetyl-CoA-carboxylase] ligase